MPNEGWKLLPLALIAGCTSVDNGKSDVVAGSPAWFDTASPKVVANYFRGQCVAYGYMPGTLKSRHASRGKLPLTSSRTLHGQQHPPPPPLDTR
jgi:hypothetical protein